MKGPISFAKHNYTDAAKTCREIRKRMYLCREDHVENMLCIHNAMIPTLNIIQPRALEEIRFNTRLAAKQRLLIELEMSIFECAMVAEEISLDPRIFLKARHVQTGEYDCKSRLVCPHVRSDRNDAPRLIFNLDSRPMVTGERWEEVQPHYPYHNMKKRRYEAARLFYDELDGESESDDESDSGDSLDQQSQASDF
jgi:hypothetical protein